MPSIFSKSQGPDKFHPYFLKETKDQLKSHYALFSRNQSKKVKSQKFGKWPTWQLYLRRMIKSLRKTISLTSVPGKILERIIRNEIVNHMTENNLFTTCQHGFIAGKSCTTQPLEYNEDITQVLDNGNGVDIIYLDFQKAFDKVPHKRLLKKLHAYGIRGQVYEWIKEFLNKRQQKGNYKWLKIRLEKCS